MSASWRTARGVRPSPQVFSRGNSFFSTTADVPAGVRQPVGARRARRSSTDDDDVVDVPVTPAARSGRAACAAVEPVVSGSSLRASRLRASRLRGSPLRRSPLGRASSTGSSSRAPRLIRRTPSSGRGGGLLGGGFPGGLFRRRLLRRRPLRRRVCRGPGRSAPPVAAGQEPGRRPGPRPLRGPGRLLGGAGRRGRVGGRHEGIVGPPAGPLTSDADVLANGVTW